MQFVSQLLNGLQLGSIYALVALGYTMVYGIVKLINFAHGDLIMVGSYVTLLLMRRANLPLAVASLGALVFCSVLGVVIERFAYRPLRKATRISALITAIAVSLLLQNLWHSADFPGSHVLHRSGAADDHHRQHLLQLHDFYHHRRGGGLYDPAPAFCEKNQDG